MSALPQRELIPFSQFEQLREARLIIQQEADGLLQLASQLDTAFCEAVRLILNCQGRVIVTGIGKAGLIGQKIAATLASTGTRAHFLHAAEAFHGDLGCLDSDDILLALSNSGESEEVCRLLPILCRMNVKLIAVTASTTSTLGREADVVVPLGGLSEAGPLGLAPSTSTTAMLALGDALALVLSRLKAFTREQFALYHPGGSLGRKLTTVREIMRRGDQLRIALCESTIRDVLIQHNQPGRRSGAVIVVDTNNRLAGLFTDSDLARLLEQRRDGQLDRPISEVMTPDPFRVSADATLSDVVELLSEKKISELPVIDSVDRVLGLIDITDVIRLMPSRGPD